MSPVRHPVSGNALVLSLAEEIGVVRRDLENATARTSRALLKDGPLRVVLVGIRAGGELREHTAAGPITIQVLEGSIECEANGTRTTLAEGTLFHLRGGIPHAVKSANGALFLLTVVSEAMLSGDDAWHDEPG